MRRSDLEIEMEGHLHLYGFPQWEIEYRFCDGRKWKFDFAWPSLRISVEVEGGTWSGGRHTSGAGFQRDCEKYNCAARDGWRVFRFTGGMVRSGEAARFLAKVFGIEEER
jgi:very-short-patch-repair endonuclease